MISIPYCVDRKIYEERHLGLTTLRNHVDLFKQPVKATLYHYGFRPVTLERPFGDFQNFDSPTQNPALEQGGVGRSPSRAQPFPVQRP